GALRRRRARLRRLASRAPRREHAGQHRDIVAAPRSHLRPEADQFAHLVDGLSDPRAGRRARQDATQGTGRVARASNVLMPATELTFAVTLAVLGAGLLHAGWN